MEEDISLKKEEILKIAENLAQVSSEITLLGGEPLIAPYIEEVICYFKEQKIPVAVITNGQVLNEKIKKVINSVATVLVSIDGFEEDNDYIRGKGTWENSIKFLEYIQDRGIDCGVTTVITKKNVDNLEKMIHYLEDKKVKKMVFNPLYISGNAKKNREELELTDEEKLKYYCKLAHLSKSVKASIEINTGSAIIDKYLRIKENYIQARPVNRCTALFGSAFCNMKGILLPCRSYGGKGIDLTKTICWNQDYGIFEKVLDCVIDEKMEVSCLEEIRCPLKLNKPSNLENLVKKLLDEDICLEYKVRNDMVFLKRDNHYYILFLRDNEYVEYTKEGYEIYKWLYKGLNVNKISENMKLDLKVLCCFLDEENLKGRIIQK